MPDPQRPADDLVSYLMALGRAATATLSGTDVPLIGMGGGADPALAVTLPAFREAVEAWLAGQGGIGEDVLQAALDRAVVAESQLEAVEAELAKKDELVQKLNLQVGLLEGDLKNAAAALDALQLKVEPLRVRNDELEGAVRRADATLRAVILPTPKVAGGRG